MNKTNRFSKEELWPKQGKLKKVLIIFAMVIVSALLITLLEEKTGFKAGRKLSFIIALICIGVWVYKPGHSAEINKEHE